MKNNKKEQLSIKTIAAFLFSFLICTVLIFITMLNRINVEKLTMEQLITEKSMKITDVISKLIYKTQTLSALVVQSDGHVEDFDKVANIIVDDPAILNVLIAPDGIVSNVFPLSENKVILGYNFFNEGDGNKEAILARDKGELVLGGPFKVMQGGQALVGRLPVYINIPGEPKKFWGLVSVTLKYPQALDRAELDSLKTMGLAYEIWRISPDTGEKQIISSSGYGYYTSRYVEKNIQIANANWYFRILPIRGWYAYPELWLMIFISICASIIIAFIVQNNHVLSYLRVQLEDMANTDPLIGIYNRRFFMEAAHTQVERSSRIGSESYVIIFDLDHFKDVNDGYGHVMGDKVLVEVASKVKKMLRTYDLLARYGGEEFIILVTDINDKDIKSLIERIRRSISEMSVNFMDKKVSVTASFGIAPSNKNISFEDSIRLADDALYKAKRDGRNRAVFYGQD